MLREVELGGRHVRYELLRKNVKNINLRVRSDGGIVASANRFVPAAAVDAFLVSKSDFLLRALEKADARAKLPESCAEGERVPYLGGALTVVLRSGKRSAAEQVGDSLLLTLRNPGNADERRRTVQRWLDGECERVVGEICREVQPRFRTYGVPEPALRFRRMRSRWGSCQPETGVLTFSRSLIAADIECIEYVVIHEFCHFLQADHSPCFHQWMDRFLPDWRERRRRLNTYPIW